MLHSTKKLNSEKKEAFCAGMRIGMFLGISIFGILFYLVSII